ncbi:hypothetical protein NITLEN_10822 [Nitrospira lenta]|uniref:Uncharacterized protein n=1 Tax=Nitrospira lenta TaxID=1436998 RepID=A0A330L9W7_9BACT|nr:hypothetical protein NITLEN_10822 [Nitrospira lenta]
MTERPLIPAYPFTVFIYADPTKPSTDGCSLVQQIVSPLQRGQHKIHLSQPSMQTGPPDGGPVCILTP